MPKEQAEGYEVRSNEKMASIEHAMFMFNPDVIATFSQALVNHIWLIGVNKSTKSFYTSDHPVVRQAHYQDPFRSFGKIASPGIEIVFPLTPQYILMLCERTAFRAYEKKDGRYIPLNHDHVRYYNSLQVAQSYRQVYCSAADFELATEMCDEHPELCDENRIRVQVE